MSADHVRSARTAAGTPSHQPDPTSVATPAPTSPVPVAGLAVGPVDDPAERAADARAGEALARLRRFPDGGTVIDAGTPAADPPRDVRRSPVPVAGARIGVAGGVLDRRTTARIDALRRSGSPLSGMVLRRMESGFGTSLGHVRVHEGPESARLNADLSARAFTSGHDIFPGGSGISPTHPDGERVLAHEIAHVLDPGGRAPVGGTTAGTAPVRRYPTELKAKVGNVETDHTDSECPSIRLTKNGRLYTIRNEGDSQGKVLYWDDEDEGAWYWAIGNRADYEGGAVVLSELEDVTATDGAVAQVPTYYEAGATGWGVSDVTATTTLQTKGLISCIAWLLYNDRAAYLTHIVVDTPEKHLTEGLEDQVQALATQFETLSGSAPTNLKMHVGPHLAYKKLGGELTDWMKALIPKHVAFPEKLSIGATEFSHQVEPSNSNRARAEWRGAPITVKEKPKLAVKEKPKDEKDETD